jgi:hypothetical protein
MPTKKTTLAIAPLIAALAWANAAQAVQMTVNNLGNAQKPGDGACELAEALTNADTNTDTSQGDCPAGSATATDTIGFSVSGTIQAGYSPGTTSSPYILNDHSWLVIDGGSQKISLDGGGVPGNRHLLRVNPPAQVELVRLTLTNSMTIDDQKIGGAVYNEGRLNVRQSLIYLNIDGHGLGPGIQNTGSINLQNNTFSANGGDCFPISGDSTVFKAPFSVKQCNTMRSFSSGIGHLYNRASGEAVIIHNTFNMVSDRTRFNFLNEGKAQIGNNLFAYLDTQFGTYTDLGGNNLIRRFNTTLILDNGGVTKTAALEKTEPAINAGVDAVCQMLYRPNGVAVDQRGVTRPQGPHCDAGAFEWVNGSIPVADAGNDQTVIPGQTVQLSGTATDADNDPMTYAWSVVSRPAGSNRNVDNPTQLDTTFRPDVGGRYVLQLVANDGYTDSVPSQVIITYDNVKPIASIVATPPAVTANGTVVQLDGGDSADADGDALTYYWSLTAPAGSTAVLNSANAPVATFVPDVHGDYVVQLYVDDPWGLSSNAVSTTISFTQLPGDISGDGIVNCADVAIVKAAFGKKTGQTGFDARADAVVDGVINIRDLTTVTRELATGSVCQ